MIFDRTFMKKMEREGQVCPQMQNKRDKILEMVLNRKLEDLSLKFVKGSREAATDGILDMAEMYDLVVTGEQIMQRIEDNLEQAVHFVSRGRIIDEQAGIVCLCYNDGTPCTRQTWEVCNNCPRRCSRFVPKEFYDKINSIVDPVRNSQNLITESAKVGGGL